MLLIQGSARGTTLTGTLFERGERAPTFKGAPNEDAPYMWVCDEFYEVESGGSEMEVGGRTVNVAFESPMPRGFDTRQQGVGAAEEHVRTQFARIGILPADVEIEIEKAEPGAEI
jgi:hypothetical protein